MASQKSLNSLLKSIGLCLPFAFILTGIYILEYFGRKRMGMMRYLVFMKREFENGWFQPPVMAGIGAVVAVIMVYIVWRIFKSRAQERDLLAYWLIIMSVLNVWLVLPQLKTLKSYHFGLIGWLVIAVGVTVKSLWHIIKMDRLRRH